MAQSKNRENELLKKRLQISFRRMMAGKAPGDKMREYIGDDLWKVRQGIEKKWLPEMNWDNYGTLWVIAHIVPLRMFDLNKEDDLRVAFHYTNLFPILSIDIHKVDSLRFPQAMLERLPDISVVQELKRRAEIGVKALDKYLMI